MNRVQDVIHADSSYTIDNLRIQDVIADSNEWNFEESKASSCDLSWDAPATFVQVKPKHVPASSLSWDDEATSVAPHSQLSVHNHEMNSNSWLA